MCHQFKGLIKQYGAYTTLFTIVHPENQSEFSLVFKNKSQAP